AAKNRRIISPAPYKDAAPARSCTAADHDGVSDGHCVPRSGEDRWGRSRGARTPGRRVRHDIGPHVVDLAPRSGHRNAQRLLHPGRLRRHRTTLSSIRDRTRLVPTSPGTTPGTPPPRGRARPAAEPAPGRPRSGGAGRSGVQATTPVRCEPPGTVGAAWG